MGAWIEICDDVDEAALSYVAPLVGAWIEMLNNCFVHSCNNSVAPLVGAWIEIICHMASRKLSQSLLSWERGLK